jgi:hypothetical protein
MAVHSRSKNGVASLAYVTAIHALLCRKRDVDARDERRERRNPASVVSDSIRRCRRTAGAMVLLAVSASIACGATRAGEVVHSGSRMSPAICNSIQR